MTNPTPHRGTPEQWGDVQERADDCQGGPACLLELRDRLAAAEQRISELEGNSSVGLTGSAPAGSLVEVLEYEGFNKTHGRTAIRAVAKWLESYNVTGTAGLLRREVERATEPTPPAGSLMEGVVDAITDAAAAYGTADEPARAAILAVADWLNSVGNNGSARELREEVERG